MQALKHAHHHPELRNYFRLPTSCQERHILAHIFESATSATLRHQRSKQVNPARPARSVASRPIRLEWYVMPGRYTRLTMHSALPSCP